MLAIFLFSCVAPTLIEVGSPLLNPGESEFAFLYEGPGWLAGQHCEDPELRLDVGPGLVWPYEMSDDELVEVWVEVSPAALGGESRCEILLPGRNDGLAIMVVVL